MMKKDTVCVGTIGAGYAACLHGNGYEKVSGVRVRLKVICDTNVERATAVQKRYGYEKISQDYHELLSDPEIDVIDIVTPPMLHPQMAREALQAGKHVICEKPLTGYFGQKGDEDVGLRVPKRKMLEKVLQEMDDLKEVIEASEGKFMYAENFVYATPIQKAAEILRAKKSKILWMKGEESVKGSTTAGAGLWSCIGGGSLTRVGCHPLTGILWLKRQEALNRGEKIEIQSVFCDTGMATHCLTEEEHRHIVAHPVDVEDVGVISITYSDGTKATVLASDVVLGGTKNYVEVYSNDAALMCNITPTDILNTYFLDEEGLENVDIAEMLPAKLGWNKAFVSDEVIRGYMGEMQDFMECVAYDRDPLSGFDIAYDTTKVLYAAYQSAEEGRKIFF
ncbi:MAG: Gfo/Idh/MocA family oxidoreductase [Lachnospiraceae bacterium]|nr:Gfo/Idh/MocA family oxidoreductase [Lachnospiraceae bacterium]